MQAAKWLLLFLERTIMCDNQWIPPQPQGDSPPPIAIPVVTLEQAERDLAKGNADA